VRNRIEAILNWGTANGYRKGENPARWDGHLSELFPSAKKVAKVQHHAAMPYDELPTFMRHLEANDSVVSRAIEFVVLTATRSGDVRGAQWREIDLKQRLWTIPDNRNKSGRVHRIPLSSRALAVLNRLPRVNDYVFPGSNPDRPIRRNAMIEALGGKTTIHGFRSSFRDWCGDRTNYPRDVAEAALDHKLPSATEVAYRRGDALEKRRRLMEQWAQFLSSEPAARAEGGEVVALHG
jgi:integrase